MSEENIARIIEQSMPERNYLMLVARGDAHKSYSREAPHEQPVRQIDYRERHCVREKH